MLWAELRPDALTALIRERPLAIWPIGALEWHGPHLPLGLDGMTAESFAACLQERVGGVRLPVLWHPITTLPHPFSLDIPAGTFSDLFCATARGLARAGICTVAVVTGHYAQGHSLELFRLAQELRGEIAVVAAAPLEPLEDDSLLDHAGRWETGQLASLRPDLINCEGLPSELRSKEHAVLGEDPRLGNPKEAKTSKEQALQVWQRWIDESLQGDMAEVEAFYARRRERYRPYVEAYFRESWEQALRDWWAEQP